MGLIGFLVFGLFVGALARLLLPGRQKIGLALTLLLGVVGSVVGGVIANLIGSGDVFELNIIGAIVAVLASVGLLAAAESAGIGAGDKRKRELNRKR
ncbi:MAG: GlsB/YeaQ/YmgE family stress response membrane protein [Thermoleophilaceae bacterium]